MHSQRSDSTLFTLRLRSFFFITNLIILVSGVITALTGFYLPSKPLLTTGVGLIILWSISAGLFGLFSFRWKCPLCVGPVWAKTKSVRNKNANKLMGLSYRLGVASSVLTKRPYRCPHCGERFSSVKTRNVA